MPRRATAVHAEPRQPNVLAPPAACPHPSPPKYAPPALPKRKKDRLPKLRKESEDRSASLSPRLHGRTSLLSATKAWPSSSSQPSLPAAVHHLCPSRSRRQAALPSRSKEAFWDPEIARRRWSTRSAALREDESDESDAVSPTIRIMDRIGPIQATWDPQSAKQQWCSRHTESQREIGPHSAASNFSSSARVLVVEVDRSVTELGLFFHCDKLRPTIQSVVVGGWAEGVGIQRGFVIKAINEKDTVGMRADALVRALKSRPLVLELATQKVGIQAREPRSAQHSSFECHAAESESIASSSISTNVVPSRSWDPRSAQHRWHALRAAANSSFDDQPPEIELLADLPAPVRNQQLARINRQQNECTPMKRKVSLSAIQHVGDIPSDSSDDITSPLRDQWQHPSFVPERIDLDAMPASATSFGDSVPKIREWDNRVAQHRFFEMHAEELQSSGASGLRVVAAQRERIARHSLPQIEHRLAQPCFGAASSISLAKKADSDSIAAVDTISANMPHANSWNARAMRHQFLEQTTVELDDYSISTPIPKLADVSGFDKRATHEERAEQHASPQALAAFSTKWPVAWDSFNGQNASEVCLTRASGAVATHKVAEEACSSCASTHGEDLNAGPAAPFLRLRTISEEDVSEEADAGGFKDLANEGRSWSFADKTDTDSTLTFSVSDDLVFESLPVSPKEQGALSSRAGAPDATAVPAASSSLRRCGIAGSSSILQTMSEEAPLGRAEQLNLKVELAMLKLGMDASDVTSVSDCLLPSSPKGTANGTQSSMEQRIASAATACAYHSSASKSTTGASRKEISNMASSSTTLAASSQRDLQLNCQRQQAIAELPSAACSVTPEHVRQHSHVTEFVTSVEALQTPKRSMPFLSDSLLQSDSAEKTSPGQTCTITASAAGHDGKKELTLMQPNVVDNLDQESMKPSKRLSDLHSGAADDATTLMMASREGFADVVRHLLAARTDPQVQDEHGFSPLHFAAEAGATDIVLGLLEARAHPNGSSGLGRWGNTPLHIAASRGSAIVVEHLLGAAACPSTERADGLSPLHFAVQSGQESVVSLLLAAKAPPSPSGLGDFTPLHDAADSGHVGIAKSLIVALASPHVIAEGGVTPLHGASRHGHADVSALLLASGALINSTSDGGFTPLHDASHEGHLHMVLELLRSKASLGATTEDGASALHLSAQAGHTQVAVALLTARACADSCGQKGISSPIHLAARRGHLALARTLRQHAARARAIRSRSNLVVNADNAPSPNI